MKKKTEYRLIIIWIPKNTNPWCLLMRIYIYKKIFTLEWLANSVFAHIDQILYNI